jgi:ribose transport system permease protein
MLVLAAFLGIASVGQTIAALVGGIDLSIPFVIGMANVMVAELAGNHAWSSPSTILVIIAIAAAVGLVNGALTWSLGASPLVVTLGVGFAVQGGVQIVTQGNVQGQAPHWLTMLSEVDREVLGLPFPPVVWVWGVVILVVAVMLRATRYGRHIYAAGDNPTAADAALIRRRRVVISVYALSAVAASVAGMLLSGFTGGGYVDVGNPYLFTTIAAVVIGGTSLLGGQGGYIQTVLGVLVLTGITTVLGGKGLDGPAQQAVLGGLIVGALCIYGREAHPRSLV